ncbi:MAG: hypothetical protein DRP12_01810 [Candidatus Aenigmatarchaeota archaeon]|nr:MAG: hypothetical protein DRP12_01810 [Candidatus Aenigmarchaeota archaeon]
MQGLSQREAEERLKRFGLNEIRRVRRTPAWKIFLLQFTSPLVLILILAALVSAGTAFLGQGHFLDAILILAIVVANGVFGFFQEWKAEKAIEALRKLSAPRAKVIRDGKIQEIDARFLVPGDLVLLEDGDIIPADGKLLEGSPQIDESVFTGESVAVRKSPGDNLLMSTWLTAGRAKMLVERTGMLTELGRLAKKMQEIEKERTPFELELSRFSKKIGIGIAILTLILLGIGCLKFSLLDAVLVSISLAVAAIPEGLPAVVTLSLALAAGVMVKKNSLVRRLSVIESLGAVDVICTDKTGTLTKNQMEVVKWSVKPGTPEWRYLLLDAALCNNAIVADSGFRGDQTEVALKRFAKTDLKGWKRIEEIPFTPERKLMTVVVKKDKVFTFMKGAPEVVVERCRWIMRNGKRQKLDRDSILKLAESYAKDGLRVLGFAFKSGEKNPEYGLTFLGLLGLRDPPRPEVKQAIKECRTAGIDIIMLTGDHPETAKAIGRQIGLNSGVVLGSQIEKMDDDELYRLLKKTKILARVNPFHKLRVLAVLKKRGLRVAMTGDGVNDSLSLKKADVGIAMGIRGTDVAKEASDMILLDDNFASITAAIKEGRRVFDNIRKFVNYLLTCNLAEVGVIFFATLFLTLKEPILLPVQLLWVNLLTDGLPALALGVDPARPGIMQEPPRKAGELIINRKLAWLIGTIGGAKTLILLFTFLFALPLGFPEARTVLFTGFVLYEFVRIGSIRYQEKLNWLSNRWLLLALAISIILQLLIIYTPLSSLFHLVPIGLTGWTILLSGVVVAYLSAIAITWAVMKYIR